MREPHYFYPVTLMYSISNPKVTLVVQNDCHSSKHPIFILPNKKEEKKKSRMCSFLNNTSQILHIPHLFASHWAAPNWLPISSVQFSSVAQSCPTLCDPINRSTPGLPVHHHLPEFTQTHVHRVGDALTIN